jgi:hypothetical protein
MSTLRFLAINDKNKFTKIYLNCSYHCGPPNEILYIFIYFFFIISCFTSRCRSLLALANWNFLSLILIFVLFCYRKLLAKLVAHKKKDVNGIKLQFTRMCTSIDHFDTINLVIQKNYNNLAIYRHNNQTIPKSRLI